MAAHKLAAWKWRVVPVDAEAIAPAPQVATLVNEWDAKVSKIVDVPAGEASKLPD